MSVYGDQMIAAVAEGLRGSEYGRRHASQVSRIEARARPFSDRLGATSDWTGGGRGPDQLNQLKRRIDGGRYDEAQTARIFNSLDTNMNGFVTALERGNLLSYVDRVAGARAPAAAPQRRVADASPAPAAPPRDRSTRAPARDSGGTDGSRRSTPSPQPGASGDRAGAGDAAAAAPAAPAPAPRVDALAFVNESVAQAGRHPAEAGRTLTAGMAEKMAPMLEQMGVTPEEFSTSLTSIMSDDAQASRVGNEISQNGTSIRRDIENLTPDTMEAFLQKYPELSSTLFAAAANANPQAAAKVSEGILGMAATRLDAANPEAGYGGRIADAFSSGRGAEAFQAAIRDPQKMRNLMRNMERMTGTGENALSPEAMTAIIPDAEAKPAGYVDILTSSNPAAMGNYMSDAAYEAFAQTQQPSGIEGMLMRFMLGEDFDFSKAANRGVIACLAAQPDAIKSCMRELSAEGEAISAGGGSRSMFQSARLYLRSVTDMDFRDEVNSAGRARQSASAWAERNGVTNFGNAVVQRLDVETGLMTTLPPPGQAQPQTGEPAADVPGNRRVPQAGDIMTVDPNAYI